MRSAHQFLQGGLYFFRGFSILATKGIRRYVIVPLITNMLLFSALILAGLHYFNRLLIWADQWIPHWLQWLNVLLWIGFALVALLITTYTFTLIANVIAAPFNGLLSHKVEHALKLKQQNNTRPFSLLKETPRMIKRQLQLLRYAACCLLIAVLFLMIPLIQIPAGILWFFFSSWMLAVQYSDYPMDNHGIDFPSMKQKMAQQRAMTLGFGIATNIAALLPIINFLVMPAAVIGATMMWANEPVEGR